MDNIPKVHHLYVKKLISLVKERPGLWYKKHDQYRSEKCRERYWDEIVFRLQYYLNTKDITVETCKASWQHLEGIFIECVQHDTASVFELYKNLRFLHRNKDAQSGCCDGIFERTSGKMLLPIHALLIVMSVGIFAIMDYNGCFTPMVNPDAVSTLAIWLMFSVIAGMYSFILPFKTEMLFTCAKRMFICFVIYVIITILISTLLICLHKEPYLDDSDNGWVCRLLMIPHIFLQFCSYFYHSTKLSRPPMFIEYSMQLTVLIGSAAILLFVIPICGGNIYCSFFSLSLLIHAVIIITYVVVAKNNTSQYRYTGVNFYSTSPESPKEPFTVIIVNRVEQV